MSITIDDVRMLREAIGGVDWQRNEDTDAESAPIQNHYGHAILEVDGGAAIKADDDDLNLVARAPEIADLCIDLADKLSRIEAIAGGAA